MRYALLAVLSLLTLRLAAQDRNQDMYYGIPHSDDGLRRQIITHYGKANGYIVLKGDTLKGAIMMSKTELYFEKYELGGTSKYYVYKLRDRDLQTIMMYNYDNKPLCITRIQPTDKKMHRVLHIGKLNIYDDWVKYIYNPSDIDPYLIVVSYNGEVEKLGSFVKSGTRHDLIAYINDIYGTNYPYNMDWNTLLHKMDELD